MKLIAAVGLAVLLWLDILIVAFIVFVCARAAATRGDWFVVVIPACIASGLFVVTCRAIADLLGRR